MSVLTLFEADALPADLKYQMLAAMRIQWPNAFRGARALWDYTQKFNPARYVLLSEQDVLLSFAEINQRWLHYADHHWQVLVLSAVYTFPHVRGHGFGLQVVQAASADIRESSADLALLFCESELVGLYERCGWHHFSAVAHTGGLQSDALDESPDVALAMVLSARAQHERPAWEALRTLYVGRGL